MPVTVPKHFRTQRLIPRITAFCGTLLWIVGFFYGTSAISQLEASEQKFLEQTIALGKDSIGIYPSQTSTVCVGLLRTELVSSTKPKTASAIQLRAQGRFRVKTLQEIEIANASFTGNFDQRRRLNQLSSTVELPQGNFKFQRPSLNQPVIAYLESPLGSQEIAIGNLSDVLLVPQGKSGYRLHFPNSSANNSFSQVKLHAKKLNPGETQKCHAQVNDLTQAPGVVALDAKSYLTVLQNNISAQFLEKLTGAQH